MEGWIGVGLDGTLAETREWRGPQHIGKPIGPMMRRVRRWLKGGVQVQILTPRACNPDFIPHVEHWLMQHGLPCLPVTNEKDFGCHRFWQDHCVRVQRNTGMVADQIEELVLQSKPAGKVSGSGSEHQRTIAGALGRVLRELRHQAARPKNAGRFADEVARLRETETELFTGWIAVDLDGTLAMYEDWEGPEHIGAPVPAMLERVKLWRFLDIEVRIFTARASEQDYIVHIQNWLQKQGLEPLKVTNQVDFNMIQLWDDRCVHVETNTGMIADQWR